jgi:hypothetical protein
MESALARRCLRRWRTFSSSILSIIFELSHHSAVNLHAMRMGPGKHLKGKTLMNGIVTPEEVRFITSSCFGFR